MIEQSKQQKTKAEIQQILKEGKGISKTSSDTSEEDEMIFIEATISGEVIASNMKV